jgi:hypothetical protein
MLPVTLENVSAGSSVDSLNCLVVFRIDEFAVEVTAFGCSRQFPYGVVAFPSEDFVFTLADSFQQVANFCSERLCSLIAREKQAFDETIIGEEVDVVFVALFEAGLEFQ